MRTSFECLDCIVSLAIRTARLASADPHVQERILREALIEAAHLDFASPPVMAGRTVQRLVRRLTGSRDPYRGLKERSTALGLRLLPDLRRRVLDSPNPLGTALSVAAAASALDFGISPEFEEHAIREALIKAAGEPIGGALDAFAVEAARAREILYIADNAGELVFDSLLIELLGPAKVTLAVRGAPMLNDGTIEDARAARLTDMVLVIDTGSDLPGVVLEECSDEFRQHFEDADLIIAKGHGNYETLDAVDAPIWFVLKIKCDVIARAIGAPAGQTVLSPQQRQAVRGKRDARAPLAASSAGDVSRR